jgi:GNAT superfamily N-acetyltransferase
MIRTLTPGDFAVAAPRLAEILVDAVEGGAGVSFVLPFTKKEALAFWSSQQADVETGRTVPFVAEEDGVIAAVVLLQMITKPNQPHRCEVAKLLVHSDYQRRGIGRALMQALEAEAKTCGRTLIMLDAVAHGGAESFYRNLGYTFYGLVPRFALAPDQRWHDCAFFYKEV